MDPILVNLFCHENEHKYVSFTTFLKSVTKIYSCYMMLVCILIQKGDIVSIEITCKHIKTHK